MATLTNLTNKMQSVGKGLQRTSAFPIDKWQLWDSYNPQNGTLIFTDPSSGNITECETPDELAQLVAKSIVAYPGFTFSVVDINRITYTYKVDNNNSVKLVSTSDIDTLVEGFKSEGFKTPYNGENAAILYPRYNQNWQTGTAAGLIYGQFLSLHTYTSVENTTGSAASTEISSSILNTNELHINSIRVWKASQTQTGPVYMSIYKMNDNIHITTSSVENAIPSEYTYVGTSDTSINLSQQDYSDFTFNNSNIILNKSKNYKYLLVFTNTNDINQLKTYNSNNIVGRYVQYGDGGISSTLDPDEQNKILSNSNGTQFLAANWIALLKFFVQPILYKAKNPADDLRQALDLIYPQLNSQNTFTDRNTFTDISASSISSESINLNDWAVGVHSETGNYAGALRIGTTDINKPIILDTRNQTTPTTYGRIIAYGNIQLSSDNSTISYKTDLPTSYNDNTLATTKFTKSNINSVSSALNTAISTVSSNITTIVNNASSFISGEVSNLSSKVINDVSSVSSAIDSKIIMRIWN